jgi:hypothetical protein
MFVERHPVLVIIKAKLSAAVYSVLGGEHGTSWNGRLAESPARLRKSIASSQKLLILLRFSSCP